MKKIQFLITLFFVLFLLVGCAPRFPQVSSSYISPFELTKDEELSVTNTVLSPDGENMVVSWAGGLDLADLHTGKRTAIGDKTLWDLQGTYNDMLTEIVSWSFDGRYLGVLANHWDGGQVFYVLDMQDNSVKRYADLWATRFSPFNSYQVTSDKGIYNLKDGTVIPYPVDFDLSQEQEFGATDYGTLWSKSLGAPVAELGSLPHPDNADVEVALQSYNPMDPVHPKYSIPVGLTVKYPNQLARILFNPTGEYILALEWQCSESQTLCSDDSSFPNNVHDTVLTIIRWRTGEQKELIRLSEIDPKNVVAYGYMAWSADGNTIFISRKDALPIVLKVK